MILVVTGGIGSGKSLASEILNSRFGFPVYDADSRVKRLYDEHPTLLSEIERELGVSLRNKEGEFVPSELARVIFSDDEALAKVEALVFPCMKEDFESWVSENDSAVHILESATILEKEFFRGFGDAFLVIDAPLELRIRRASSRDKASEDAVRARAGKQILMNRISEEGYLPEGAVYVCRNNGSVGDLEAELVEFVEKQLLTKMLYK